MSGLILSDDLMDTSRVTALAGPAGLSVRSARSVEALLRLAGEEPPACVFLDLHHGGLDLPELLKRLGETCPRRPRVIGYGSHVDAARLRAAREAGCDLVLPRSAFVERLPRELSDWLTPPQG